jgi:hypothetical protein
MIEDVCGYTSMSFSRAVVLYDVRRGLAMGFPPTKGFRQMSEELIAPVLILNWHRSRRLINYRTELLKDLSVFALQRHHNHL